MSNDEQKDEIVQEVAAETPATTVPAEVDEVAVQLAVIESENPSGEVQAATPAEESQPVASDSQPAAIAEATETKDIKSEEKPEQSTVVANALAAADAKQKPRKIAGLFTSKKQAVLTAVIAGVLVLGGGAGAFALLYQPPVPEAQTAATTQPKPVAKMGVAVTVADGTVTYQKASGGEWSPVTTDTQLAEGAQVKTAAESRAVLLFDDGSALRLDANTTVGLTSLKADDIKIAQVDGTAYSRVVPSKRSYTVAVDGVNYKALGTAFSTVKSATEKGVRVFQSQVKVSDVDTAIAEGKQYFNDNADAELKNKVTDIDYDALADSEFVKWNLAEDEKVETFKGKLGVLSKVKERAEQKLKEQEEAAARAKAAAEAKAKAEKEKAAKKDDKDEAKDKVTRGTMSLSRNGETFTWSYTGKAVHGYKLVYSKSNTTPTFGVDDALYFGSINETSGSLPDKKKTGGAGTYYVRVCAYTAGSDDEPCVDYSSVVTIVRN